MGLCPPKGPTAALNTGLKPATIRLSAEDPTTGSGDPLVVEYVPGIEPGALHRTASTITARLDPKTFGSSSVLRALATAAKGRGFDSRS